MKATILNLDKKEVGKIDLPDEIFLVKANAPLLYEVVKMQRANRRKGCAASRNRALVKGTTAKMYRQKGTGRARHGSATANIFVGGGKAFGPHPRNYSYRIPKKARRGSIRVALSLRQSEGKILILDDFPVPTVKTKDVVKRLEKLGVSSGLLVTDGVNENLEKSVRNIKDVKLVRSEGINVYDIMRHEHTIILKGALNRLQEVLKP